MKTIGLSGGMSWISTAVQEKTGVNRKVNPPFYSIIIVCIAAPPARSAAVAAVMPV